MARDAAVAPKLFQLAWPVALEQVFNMTLVWSDSIIVNWFLGTDAFAAVQMSGQVANMLGLILAIIASGTSIVMAHQIGAKEQAEAADTATQSIGLGVILGVTLGALFYLVRGPVLRLLGGVDLAYVHGLSYMAVLTAFVPFMALSFILSFILRATGDTRGPMVITLIVNVLNVVLTLAFVMGGWGVFGAGLGTGLARAVGVALLAYQLLRRSELPVRLKEAFHFRWAVVRRVLRMGIPGALEWIAYDTSQFTLSIVVGTLGTAVIAARGLVFQIESFTYMPAAGLEVAASILVGQLIGAKLRGEAVSVGKQAILWGVGFMSAGAVLLLLIPEQIARLFTQDPAVLTIVVPALRIAALYKAGQALNIICGGIFRGAGNPEWPPVVTAIGAWGITVPAAYLAVRWGYGLSGVLWAMFADEMIRGAVNLWYFTTPRWRNRSV